MTLIIGTMSNGLIIILCISALIIGFGASYLIWQLALKNKSRKIISEAEAEAEVARKEKTTDLSRLCQNRYRTEQKVES